MVRNAVGLVLRWAGAEMLRVADRLIVGRAPEVEREPGFPAPVIELSPVARAMIERVAERSPHSLPPPPDAGSARERVMRARQRSGR